MRDSVPSASYSSVCNVLRQWNIPLIPTYRVYRLYDINRNFILNVFILTTVNCNTIISKNSHHEGPPCHTNGSYYIEIQSIAYQNQNSWPVSDLKEPLVCWSPHVVYIVCILCIS